MVYTSFSRVGVGVAVFSSVLLLSSFSYDTFVSMGAGVIFPVPLPTQSKNVNTEITVICFYCFLMTMIKMNSNGLD